MRASVNGRITNMDLRPGAYVTVGRGVMALIDEDTLRVEGYFEETKLPRIHVNDKATVRLLGEASALSGRVQSIAGGIEDRERSAGTNLLANVNPTFAWVRLAQRIPVRIVLDPLPDGVNLISGRPPRSRSMRRPGGAAVAARSAPASAVEEPARDCGRRRPMMRPMGTRELSLQWQIETSRRRAASAFTSACKVGRRLPCPMERA